MMKFGAGERDGGVAKTLKLSMGQRRDFTPRWSCLITLFRHFGERTLVRLQRGISVGISRDPRSACPLREPIPALSNCSTQR